MLFVGPAPQDMYPSAWGWRSWAALGSLALMAPQICSGRVPSHRPALCRGDTAVVHRPPPSSAFRALCPCVNSPVATLTSAKPSSDGCHSSPSLGGCPARIMRPTTPPSRSSVCLGHTHLPPLSPSNLVLGEGWGPVGRVPRLLRVHQPLQAPHRCWERKVPAKDLGAADDSHSCARHVDCVSRSAAAPRCRAESVCPRAAVP